LAVSELQFVSVICFIRTWNVLHLITTSSLSPGVTVRKMSTSLNILYERVDSGIIVHNMYHFRVGLGYIVHVNENSDILSLPSPCLFQFLISQHISFIVMASHVWTSYYFGWDQNSWYFSIKLTWVRNTVALHSTQVEWKEILEDCARRKENEGREEKLNPFLQFSHYGFC